MIGPGWIPTCLDDRDEAINEEVDLFYRGSQDHIYAQLFEEWTAGLPHNEGIMYGASDHTIPILEEVLEITGAERILEIGFGIGCSSAIFLELSRSMHVTSIDITKDASVLAAASFIRLRFPRRFKFINEDSRNVALDGRWDLIYIDGNHERDHVLSDIILGKKLRIPFFLMDDLWPYWGPGVRQAAEDAELVMVKRWGNVGLFTCG